MKWTVPLFLFPIPYLFVFFWIKIYILDLRYAPRFAKDSGKPMRLLIETEEEDQYLSKGQITEEEIGSADYDVWLDEEDGEVLILQYDLSFSKYTTCTQCNYNTCYKSHSGFAIEATENSIGIWEDCFTCKNCNFKYSKVEEISKINAYNNSDDHDNDDSYSGFSGSFSDESPTFDFDSDSFGGG